MHMKWNKKQKTQDNQEEEGDLLRMCRETADAHPLPLDLITFLLLQLCHIKSTAAIGIATLKQFEWMNNW